MCEVTLKDLIFQYSSVKLITLCEQKARFGFSTNESAWSAMVTALSLMCERALKTMFSSTIVWS
jgi:hypothetical protein